MTMFVAGSGTGRLNYVINNEPVTGSDCTVEGLEDDDSGVLQLMFSFTDVTHGDVAVEVSLDAFSPATTTYDDPLYLVILVTMDGGSTWQSGPGASVTLSVTTTAANGSTEYRGFVNAESLASVGGTQNVLAIKFASFDVTLEP